MEIMEKDQEYNKFVEDVLNCANQLVPEGTKIYFTLEKEHYKTPSNDYLCVNILDERLPLDFQISIPALYQATSEHRGGEVLKAMVANSFVEELCRPQRVYNSIHYEQRKQLYSFSDNCKQAAAGIK